MGVFHHLLLHLAVLPQVAGGVPPAHASTVACARTASVATPAPAPRASRGRTAPSVRHCCQDTGLDPPQRGVNMHYFLMLFQLRCSTYVSLPMLSHSSQCYPTACLMVIRYYYIRPDLHVHLRQVLVLSPEVSISAQQGPSLRSPGEQHLFHRSHQEPR